MVISGTETPLKPSAHTRGKLTFKTVEYKFIRDHFELRLMKS